MPNGAEMSASVHGDANSVRGGRLRVSRKVVVFDVDADCRGDAARGIDMSKIADADVVLVVRPDGSGQILKNRDGREGEIAAEDVPAFLRSAERAAPETGTLRMSADAIADAKRALGGLHEKGGDNTLRRLNEAAFVGERYGSALVGDWEEMRGLLGTARTVLELPSERYGARDAIARAIAALLGGGE